MSNLLKYGHRSRAPQLSSDSIPALLAGVLLAQQYGNDWFVNSAAASGGNGAAPGDAKTTLAAALALAQSGDRIFIAPGHTENITGAASLTISQSGLTIIGLGVGSKRPTFTWTATAATLLVSGADNIISNIRCTCSIDEVVKLWDVTGARVTLDSVDYFETAAMTPIQFLAASAAAVDFTLQGCRHVQTTASASNSQWVEFIGARSRILGNTIILAQTSNAASKVLSNGTAAVSLEVAGNRIHQTGASALAISLHASSDGIAADNRVCSTGTLAGKIALGGCMGLENYCATTANKNGILDPVVA
jgi:hypothetical protein